ncbi:MAG: response regulator transcription factor, partial [Chloroflexota bacterium]
AVLRRAGEPAVRSTSLDTIRMHDLELDRRSHELRRDGEVVALTAREFDLLSFLIGHGGRVHSRDSLLTQVWGPGFVGDRKTVDVHIRWLRAKLAGKVPFEIVTVRGIGYRLDRTA